MKGPRICLDLQRQKPTLYHGNNRPHTVTVPHAACLIYGDLVAAYMFKRHRLYSQYIQTISIQLNELINQKRKTAIQYLFLLSLLSYRVAQKFGTKMAQF